MKLAMLFLGSAALVGCAAQSQLHGVAIDYNELVAETTDELTLLNIVRARHRYPMHFTSLSALRGNATFMGQFGLGASFPGDTRSGRTSNVTTVDGSDGATVADTIETVLGSANSGFSPSIGVSASSTPSFDVAVLNTETFQRGILQPLKADLVGFYLDQGFPESLIEALFIERLTFTAATDMSINGRKIRRGETVAQFDNDPGEHGECFKEYFADHILRARRGSNTTERLALPATLLANASLEEIAILDGDRFDLAIEKGSDAVNIVRIEAGETQLTVELVDRALEGRERRADRGYGKCLVDQLASLISAGFVRGPEDEEGESNQLMLTHPSTRVTFEEGGERVVEVMREGGEADQTTHIRLFIAQPNGMISVPLQARVTLRSVQGVHYFLGEVTREGQPTYLLRNEDGGESTLFLLREGVGPNAALSTNFQGRRWSIDRPRPTPSDRSPDDRSLQVIDILQQILNLQRSAEELPRTQAVTLVR